MNYIYYYVVNANGYNDEVGNFHQAYFEDGGAFGTTLLIALISAAVFAAVFYFVICNLSNALSKFWMWFVFLILCGVVTVGMTSNIVVGSDENGEYTGFYANIDNTCSVMKEETYANNPVEQEKLDKAQEKLFLCLNRDETAENPDYNVIDTLYLWNCLYAIAAFIIFSILIKGTTRYGIGIPCTWPRKLHV